MYKCLYGLVSAYLKDLLTIDPKQELSFNDKMPLLVARSNLMSYSERAFSHAAPQEQTDQ